MASGDLFDYNTVRYATYPPCLQTRGFLHLADRPVAYVVVEGRMHLVDGHHRVRAAKELGIGQIPAQEVRLLYQGYRSEIDLFDWER